MTGHYSAGQRRALNQIWNGAGVYGFEPLFLSLNGDGTPNLYLNTIVGCVRRWYGEEGPARLFAAWAEDRRQALLDDLAWLALESAAFQTELPCRPVLAQLRREHAAGFFDREHTLSRQEWMAKNQLSYTMQSARWKAVLGSRPPVMTPYEKRLSSALALGPLEEQELFSAILDIFARFRLFDGRSRPPPLLRFHLTGRWAGVMTRLMPTEIVHTDTASPGHASGGGDGPRLDTRRARIRLKENAASDRQYIESCFGSSLLPPRELAQAEQKLCTGVHLGCHLWHTAGVPAPEQAPAGEARRLAEQAQLQYERNRAAFGADSALYQNAVRRLTEQIQNCFQVHSQTEEEVARSGRLDSPRVWRAAVLSDRWVFVREADTPRPGFAVDLLLDASASRMHCQETIAAQGYILAESLARCGIPVRVSGFCSLRGYTVLRVLKNFGENSRNVFRYFAAGCSIYTGAELLAIGAGGSTAVYDICQKTMGSTGMALAMLGVIACPITSGDTAFRSARLTLADWLKIDQKSYASRLKLCIPVLGVGAVLGIGNALGKIDYNVIWRYFSWSNQTLAMIVLWAASMYLFQQKKNYWITAIPATFMSAVSSTYFILGEECLGQLLNKHEVVDGARKLVAYNLTLAYPVGILFAAAMLFLFLRATKKQGVKA